MARRLLLLTALLTVSACGSTDPTTSEPIDSSPAPTAPASTTTATSATVAPTTTTAPTLADDPRITSASKLTDPNECKIPDVTKGGFQDEVTSGFPRPADGIDSLSDLDLLVVPVSVEDSVFDDTDLEIVDEMLDSVAEFFLDQSYGRVTVNGTVAPRDSWVTLPGTTQSTGMANMTFAHDKSPIYRNTVLAAAETLDLGAYDMVAVYTHKDDRFYFGQGIGALDTPDGRLPYGVLMGGQNVILWTVLAHELGHAWLHSEDLYYFPDQNQIMLGGWDIMEKSVDLTSEFNPWIRWINSWIEDSQVRCVTSKGETVHHLETISVASDLTKMVVVKLNDNSVLVIDSRRDFGWGEGGWDANGDATIVYVVDTSIDHGQGPIRWRGELRSIGESLTTDGVTITLLDTDATSDVVSVTVG